MDIDTEKMTIYQLDVKFAGLPHFFTPHSFYSTHALAEQASDLLKIQVRKIKTTRIVAIELDSYLHGAVAHYERQSVVTTSENLPEYRIENGRKVF